MLYQEFKTFSSFALKGFILDKAFLLNFNYYIKSRYTEVYEGLRASVY